MKNDSGVSPEIRNTEKNNTKSNTFLMLFSVMFIMTIVALQPLPPNDFFPYVRIGEEIVKAGSIPTTEFMTYTQFGKSVEYPYWLPSLILMGIFKLGGVTLITILVMLCIAAYYVLLWFCLRELEIHPLLSLVLVFVFGLTAGSYFIARPQIFAFPLFGLALFILVKWQKNDDLLLWLLPLISVFWVNFHGSFIILFFLLIPALIFGVGNRKKLLIATVIALLATLINAYGIGVWKNIFAVVGNESNQIYSQEFQKPTNEGWQANILFGTFLTIPILTALLKPKVKILYWVWFVGLGWMALSGIRYGIWYLGLITILLCCILNPFVATYFKREYFQNRKMNLIIALLMFFIPISMLPGIRELWRKQNPPKYSESTPVEAIEWLRKNPQLPGEVLCDFTTCTYMSYALPERKLFMTNRMDDFPVEQYEDYLSMFNGLNNWQTTLDKYNINIVIYDYLEKTKFTEAITSSLSWEKVYRDERFAIFVRTD